MAEGKFGPPKGMRDWSPREAVLRQELIGKILGLYRLYGYQPIDTPAVENLDVLYGKGGGENEKLLFRVLKRGEELAHAKETNGELADLGLRFDLTVPLARYVASHLNDLPRVFRVCHIGPVWRADRPQKGRFREFYQCDIDVVGGTGNAHEVEILTASERALASLELGKIRIRLSDKRLLPIILRGLDVPEELRPAVSQSLDKLDKKPREEVFGEIASLLGQGPVQHRVADFVKECMEKHLDLHTLETLRFPAETDRVLFKTVLQNLNEIVETMRRINPETTVAFDPLLVRGMDYYTGPVFEAGLEGVSYSIGGGGRYDGLIGKFAGKELPAVGFSIGFERILGILLERNAQASNVALPRVFLVNNGQSNEDIHCIAEKLREAGIAVETYFLDSDFGRQMKMAEALGIRYAIKEYRTLDGTFLVRKLAERKDVSVTLEELQSQLG